LIKHVLITAFAALSLSQIGSAASCSVQTLDLYVSGGGCNIGLDTISNFSIVAGSFGGTPIAPTSVLVTPSGSTYAPSLVFSFDVLATTTPPTGPFELTFTYDISGPPFTGVAGTLSGSLEIPDGAVSGLANICEGGSFNADGFSGCSSNPQGSLVTIDGVQNSDSTTFSQVSFLNVTNDITVDPGTMGSAVGATFSNDFTAVPEPMSMALAGLGLALAGAIKFRKQTTK